MAQSLSANAISPNTARQTRDVSGMVPFPPFSFDDSHQSPVELLRHVLGVFSLSLSLGCSSAESHESMKNLPCYKCSSCCNCPYQQDLPPNSRSRWKDRFLRAFKELIDRILQLLKHLCVGATRKVADALNRTRMTASIDVHDVVTPQLLSKIERLGVGLRQRSPRIRSIARWSRVQAIPATFCKIVWELYERRSVALLASEIGLNPGMRVRLTHQEVLANFVVLCRSITNDQTGRHSIDRSITANAEAKN